MKMKKALLAWCFLSTLPCLQAQDLIIEGGTLIDGTGGPPIQDATIVISDGKFQSILQGRAASQAVPGNRTRINARGKYLIPGLIDTHAHLSDWQFELFLAHGITTVLDLGDIPEWAKAIKEAVAKGKMQGPRIYHIGRLFDGRPTPDYDVIPPDWKGILTYLDSPEQARQEVRKDIEWGADAIKINVRLAPEVLEAVCQEAHRANIPVAGHTREAREAVIAGVDFLEHSATIAMSTVDDQERFLKVLEERSRDPQFTGGIVDDPGILNDYPPHHLMNPARFDELIDLLISKNTFVNPTLLAYWKTYNRQARVLDQESWEVLKHPHLSYIPLETKLQIIDHSHASDLPGDVQQKLYDGYRKVEQFLKAFVSKGGKVVAGVDSVTHVAPGLGTHQEMWLMVQAGLTPMQALLSATKWSSEMMRKEHLLGTIEPGKLADLLILEDNPLADIRNSRKIQTVILGGKVIDHTYHNDFSVPMHRLFPPSFYTFPVPSLTEIEPIFAVEGAPDVTITLKGRGFSRSSVVHYDGTRLKTNYKDGILTALIPAEILRRVGTFPVTVWNPQPRGGTSNPVSFMVKYR
ncbi:MAG: amidohydrolase family protein [Acidobacteria bacterium]|nr:amidohydrolase family protein [Acidobacteriota bacterium]